MDLLLLQLPESGSFSSTHLAKVLSKRVKATLLSCNECGSQERGDRLYFYDPQRHVFIAIFLFLCWWEFYLFAYFSSLGGEFLKPFLCGP